MAKADPTAASLDALASQRLVIAAFHPGSTAAGHHWTVEDPDGTVLFRTRRVHQGGLLKRTAFKAATLTGLDNGNDIHAELLGRDGVVGRISSVNAKPATVTVTDASGLGVARSVHKDGRLSLHAGDSDRLLAEVVLDKEAAWVVREGAGTDLGELVAGEPGPSTSMSLFEVLTQYAPNMSSDFARTMHLGVARVMRYALGRTDAPAPPAVGLLPLLAGMSY